MEVCENCGQPIGKLETHCLIGDHIVCYSCHRKLKPPPKQGVTSTTDAVAGRVIVIIIALVFAAAAVFALLSKLAGQ